MPRRRVEGQAIQRGSHDLWRKISEPGPGAHYRGYVRFSHEAGHFGLTTEGQKDAIRAYGEARGWICDGFDEEPARSAKYEEIEQRPVFRRHIEAAERGAFAISLCYMNDRWARNKVVAYVSLSKLRRAGVWWATTDGRWNIDRIEEDGWDVAYSVDVTMNAAYSRKVSEKTRIGKNTRASLGYHNGDVMYGYARPQDPPKPADAPYNWKPPRQPLLPHAEHFTRLQQMGEWAAMGLSDQQIADAATARGWLTQTRKAIGTKRKFTGYDAEGQPTFTHDIIGPRPFTKDTIRAILIRPFPREYAPGCGKGTIIAPDGTRVMGQHPAAWPWEMWHRMDEARGQRRGSRGQERAERAWPFSGVIVCAACGNRLRAKHNARSHGYYADDAERVRKIAPCPNGSGKRAVRADMVDQQFADLLTHPMPADWRKRIAALYAEQTSTTDWGSVEMRRRALEGEKERVKFQHQHGLIADSDLLRERDRIQQALDALPELGREAERTAVSLEAGETLAAIADYWHAATDDERVRMVRALLQPEGLRYDLARQAIAAIAPRPAFLPVLTLALPVDEWMERDEAPGVLWRITLPEPPAKRNPTELARERQRRRRARLREQQRQERQVG